MALKLNLPALKTRVGVAAPNAYVKINALSFETKTGRVEMRVDFFFDQAARTANLAPVLSKTVVGEVGKKGMPNLDGTINGVRNALYTYLKTLPEFAGAVDV